MENTLKEPKKIRLDDYLLQNFPDLTKSKAQSLILSGTVVVNNQKITKAGAQVTSKDVINIQERCPYVSFGGIKLKAALDTFKCNVANLVCMDVGASTGGFTDCLLQQGASFIYAIDVGYGQLDPKIRNDVRVRVLERTNIRFLPKDVIERKIDFAVIDVSFISLRLVIPHIIPFLKNNAHLVMLFKPQFEVGKNKVGKGGIVRDTKIIQDSLEDFFNFLKAQSLAIKGTTKSPRQSAGKNQEIFIHAHITSHE